MKKIKFLLISCILIIGTISIANAYTPNKEVSDIKSCHYKITGYKSNGNSFNTGWKSLNSPQCNTNIDFSANGITDGIYDLYFKSEDNAGNKFEENKARYKIDTTKPICKLNSITLYGTKNQFYKDGRLYYKKSNDANGKFILDISCYDTTTPSARCFGEKCISGIKEINLPVLLGKTPIKIGNSNNFTLTYNWSGKHSDSMNLLNYNFKIVTDNAGNEAKLQKENTKVIFKDKNGNTFKTINGINSLILTPDGTPPSISNNKKFKIKSGNNGNGSNIDLENNSYFAATNSRKITPPTYNDNGAGLRDIIYQIEKDSNKNSYINYTNATQINHSFKDVSKNNDLNTNGYREYLFDLVSKSPDGTLIGNKICDNVGNCNSIATPNFKIVANAPDINNSINNFNNIFENKISNFSDEYNLKIQFKDKYGNIILPINGVKKVKLTAKFDNTLGKDQTDINKSKKGDGVGFKFKNKNGNNIGVLNNYKNYSAILNKSYNFPNSELNIYIKSAVPTHDEYKTANDNYQPNKSLYGTTNTSKLQLTDFDIEVIKESGINNGVGEYNATGNFITKKPKFKFNPVLSFNYIENIYPIIEGHIKNLDLKKIQKKDIDFYLNIKTKTNNNLLKIDKIGFNNNIINSNSYTITKSKMPSNNGVLKVLPKINGGITSGIKLAVYSTLEYQIEGINVKLPSIQTGLSKYGIVDENNLPFENEEITLSEIKIGGLTQARNKEKVTTDNKFIDKSKIKLINLKTNIHKNIAKLIRGQNISEAEVSNKVIINQSDFDNGFQNKDGLKLKNNNVLYIKNNDIIINCGTKCRISGQKTIIVENGNLIINSNMYYANKKSILGIILIGNKSNGNKSQLRISENVTNGVGVVYAEGPVVSVSSSDYNKVYNGNNTTENDLINQLYWKGSFATRNTIGGSIKNIDPKTSCPYGTPEYGKNNCKLNEAQGYDLIYLRRYAVQADGSIINPNSKIAGGCNFDGTNCESGLEKYPSNKKAPLIIDYDPNLQNNPPYGFEKK